MWSGHDDLLWVGLFVAKATDELYKTYLQVLFFCVVAPPRSIPIGCKVLVIDEFSGVLGRLCARLAEVSSTPQVPCYHGGEIPPAITLYPSPSHYIRLVVVADWAGNDGAS